MRENTIDLASQGTNDTDAVVFLLNAIGWLRRASLHVWRPMLRHSSIVQQIAESEQTKTATMDGQENHAGTAKRPDKSKSQILERPEGIADPHKYSCR